MDSIAAHARILTVFERDDAVAPDQWCHDLSDGSLSCRYASGENTFTWKADSVASIAAEADDGDAVPPRAAELLERWEAVERILAGAGRPSPDRVYIDHAGDEIRLVWEAEKLVVCIGPD